MFWSGWQVCDKKAGIFPVFYYLENSSKLLSFYS